MNEYQTAYEGKIFQLKLFCGKEYPESPPTVRFQTRINMACVNPETGVVEPSLFPMLANWRREYTMEDILIKLKKEMMTSHNRKLAQPPEGTFCNSVFVYDKFLDQQASNQSLVFSGTEEARADPKGPAKCCVM
ncbi:unnamed protein product [Eruca vesicaria subsp. sativa]|uniref:UBC core domain-containing protein n=1 Tax=Eruca vesicaria subsp. sativa TaxID=29727 RepID=A0ABC8LH72_ERUVS|nr:unnamed protein product [Eruca vesicaria subsp. sativa]